jgi:hypothetical protein
MGRPRKYPKEEEGLSPCQREMLALLRSHGPLADHEMRHCFGRQWRAIWTILDARGLVRVGPCTKEGRCYRSI